MKPEIQKLHNVWDQHQKAQQKTDLLKVNFDEILSSIFTAGPSYYYIIDFFDMSVSHMSPNVKEIHNLDPATATFNDILNLIHPDEVDYVARTEDKVIHIFKHVIGWEKVTKYKPSYCVRFKTADDTYRLFLHQSLQLTLDENGGFAKSLNIHTEINHLTSENNYKLSFIGLAGEPSYIDIATDVLAEQTKKTFTCYSKREVEILKLIGEGFTNSEISMKLNIALDTAKNHRRKILEKAGVKNTAQLIKKCMLEGLI